MILLVTHGHPTMVKHRHPNLGRLVQPRHYSSIAQTADAGIPWAADNDCFQGLNEDAYRRMLDAIYGLSGCLFVTSPDVVGDADATLDLWRDWREELVAAWLPLALVAQDGLTSGRVPWAELDALFIGGTTEFKLSEAAAALAREARLRGKWVHMGRVNSAHRARYAGSVGCDSIDGSSWSRWTNAWLRYGIRVAAAPVQQRLVA